MEAKDLTILPWPPSPQTGMLTGSMPAGVKVIHKPTGLEAICTEHRQQYKNRDAALSNLKAQLHQRQQ